MLAKLFGRPESVPAAPQPRERFRPTLPPVEANRANIDALTELGATPTLIASYKRIEAGSVDPAIREGLLIIGQLAAVGWMEPTEEVTFLRDRVGQKSGVTIEVQPIVDAVEATQGPIINNAMTYEAIATLYDASVADLPIEPGVEADVWKGHVPSLEVTIDGRRTAPLAPNRSIPIKSVAQRVDWDRIAVRAGLVRDRWATAVISNHVLGKPRLNYEELPSTKISAEAQNRLVDFVLNDIEANGGNVRDVAFHIQKAARDARHAEIVKGEAPRRAMRSAASFLSRPFKGQR